MNSSSFRSTHLIPFVFVAVLAACDRAPDNATNAAAIAPAAPSNPTPSHHEADWLAKGNGAFRAGRLVAPPGDNALEYFLAARDRDPTNQAAREAVVDLIPATQAAVETRIAARDLAEAERILGLFERATPGSMTVESLRRDLIARPTAAVAAPAPASTAPAVAARPAPAALLPTEPAAAARTAAAEPPTPARTAAVSEPELARAIETKPAETIVPAPAATFTAPVLASRAPPEYPSQARAHRQEGWVELEFTVGTDGRVSDVDVVDAQPKGVFENAAQRTITRWRYSPASRAGQPEATRTRARLTFKLS